MYKTCNDNCKNNHYKTGIQTNLYNGTHQITVKIDQKIHKIILMLNQLNCHTSSSCEQINSGPMAGLCWVQFVNVEHFQNLLKHAKNGPKGTQGAKVKHERLLQWLNGLCNSKVWVLGKPTLNGDMKIDFYFQVHDIQFFESCLSALLLTHYLPEKIKSKL